MTVKIGTSTTMSSLLSNGHPVRPDSSSPNTVTKETMSENKFIESSHPQESSELIQHSSTYTSMAALRNIALSKSAPHSIISSPSGFEDSTCEESRLPNYPYKTHNGQCESIDFNHMSDKGPSIDTPQTFLRRGKWSQEEEEYANAVVKEFNSGYLDAQPGTTLRIYLSEKLQCDPMRITKKFTGHDSIGKRVFHPTGRVDGGLTREARLAQVSSSTRSIHQNVPFTLGCCILNTFDCCLFRQILNSFITNGSRS